jgi:hypothetical protein
MSLSAPAPGFPRQAFSASVSKQITENGLPLVAVFGVVL